MSNDENRKRIESQSSATLDKALEDSLKSTREMVDSFKKRVQKNPNDAEAYRDYYMMVNFEVLYRVSVKNRKALSEVNEAIQQLPDRQEFEKLKLATQAAISEQKQKTDDTEQKVTDTLLPINDLLKELQKLKESKPFGEMYG